LLAKAGVKMKRENNPYEGNKRILEDEGGYEDYRTILLINLIADLVVTATLAQAETAEEMLIPKEINPSI
jgi:hypothetical protein